MILPATTLACVLLLFLALFCWGSWANSQRLVFKWRFELFYYDFALGVALCVAIAALTLGAMNSQELTVSDNLVLAGYRKMAYAVAAGVIVNLANMLMVASISVSGLTVALPLTFGIGLVVNSVSDFIGNPHGSNPLLLFAGLALVLVALVVDIFAYRSHLDALASLSKAGPSLDPRTRLPVRTPMAARGIALAAAGGIFYGLFLPAVDSSRSGDNGVGPYGLAGLLGAGLLFSTLLYGAFFVNFPVQGAPINALDYFKGTKKQHLLGLLGGFIWAVGLLATLVEAASPAARPVAALSTGLIYGAPVLGVIWGVAAWQEFKGATMGVKMMLLGVLVLYVAGLAMASLAPAYASK